MQQAHEQHRHEMNGIPPVTPNPPAGVRTVSRIYERQGSFLRDVPRRNRQGWRLVGTRHQPGRVPLDVIRASAPGALLHGSRDRVIAYYACVSVADGSRSFRLASTLGNVTYQTRLATSAWLARLAHTIQPPCCPE